MKVCLKIFVVAVLLSGMSAAAADFSRYAGILDRRPFAPLATEDDSAGVVTLVQPPTFVKDLRMCAITESPAGVKVGFVNIKAKPPQPYYLYVGDAEDGIQLVAADYEKEGALLRKDAEQYWVYMRGDGPAAAPAAEPRGFVPRVGVGAGGGGSVSPNAVSAVDGPGGGRMSYAARRLRRLEEMRKRAEVAKNLSDKDVEKKLQAYQMDLIRKGLTPLPIPLTPEMDDQLVKEGILPPAEVETVVE